MGVMLIICGFTIWTRDNGIDEKLELFQLTAVNLFSKGKHCMPIVAYTKEAFQVNRVHLNQ